MCMLALLLGLYLWGCGGGRGDQRCICNKMGGAWKRCQFGMGYPYLQEKQREYYLDVTSFTIEAKTSCALIKVR